MIRRGNQVSDKLEEKKQQALMVKQQVEILLRRYELSDADNPLCQDCCHP